MQKQKNEQKHKPVYVGFGSLKGGVGKSSIAEILASYLYYEKKINLFVVDCDFSQYSFFNMRERDKQTVQNGNSALLERMKKHFESFGKPAYRILKSTSERALQDAESFLAKHSAEKFDYVFFDLPGRADDTALVGLTVDTDYVISPIEPDPQSLVACMTYALAVRDLGVSLTSSKIRQIYMLWNKIDKRVNPAVIEFYDQEIARQELGILDSRLPRSSRFKKELTPDNRDVFRSTYLPPDKKLLAGSNIEELAEEIIRKLTL
jgi:cellulose biosynthesis protein BcsQ